MHTLARRDWINALQGSPAVSGRTRRVILRRWGVRLRHCSISPGCYFGAPDISIGDYTRLNRGVYLDCNNTISIGQWCNLAMGVMLVTSTHAVGPQWHRAGDGESASVTIGDGVWLGARVLVLPGVTIGRGCIVAGGAVVTQDCLPDGLYGGVPARRIRDLDEEGTT